MSSSHRDESTSVTAPAPAAPVRAAIPSTSPGSGDAEHERSGVRARVRRFVRREHSPVPLRRMLVKAVVNGAVIPICFVGSFAVTATLPPFMSIGPSHAPPRSTGPLTSEQVVVELIDAHGCWMGAAPKDMEGKMPGHAVITWPEADGPVYGGARAVKAGLEHVFAGEHEGLQVHGFCR